MHADDVDPWLAATLADHRLSRRERRELAAELEDREWVSREALDFVRHRAFALAKEEGRRGTESESLFDWLEGVIKTLATVGGAVPNGPGDPSAGDGRVLFSPGDACLHALQALVRNARSSVDVCVFTITDDRLTDALLDAHQRGVPLRIITDDDKSGDRGSDANRLRSEGVSLRFDQSEHHMHHKFAVFDRRVVATGSYNWTRSAARHNRENVAVTKDTTLVSSYQRGFDQLWNDLG